MSALAKGKGKSPVPAMSTQGGDADLDMFIVRRRWNAPTRSLKPPPSPPRPSAGASDSEEYEDGEDEHGRPLKRKKRKYKPKSTMPAWTRGSAEVRKRATGERQRSSGSTSKDRARSDVIVIDCSDEDDSHGKRRHRVDLTPPPDRPEGRKKDLDEVVRRHFPQPDDGPLPASSSPAMSAYIPNSSPSGPREEAISISVQMIVDPRRREEGASEAAIRQYQKIRTFALLPSQPLEVILNSLAALVGKRPEELILVYRGSKIYSLRLTPKSLKVQNGDMMDCYEQAFWQRSEGEKQRALQAQIKGESSNVNDDDDDDDDDGPPSKGSPILALVVEEAPKILLILRGGHGEFRLRVVKTITGSLLLRHYRQKAALDPGQALQLHFDGEVISENMTVGDMGVEDQEMIDVV